MSIDECADADDGLGACTLRIEYQADWLPHRVLWRANLSGYRRPPSAVSPRPTAVGDDDRLLRAQDPVAEDACDTTDHDPFDIPAVKPPLPVETPAPVAARAGGGTFGLAAVLTVCTVLVVLGWRYTESPAACWLPSPLQAEAAGRLAADVVARKIVRAESGGDPNAKNSRSSATGAGQFLDGTWLDMIRAYRPDLKTKAEAEILDLRYDPDISREMVARFAEENAEMLVGRCLPVTPGTLYLAHFAGGAGAVAVLSAPDSADAATTMAAADSTGRTTRDMLVTANPFLRNFSIADLKRWADRKMGTHSGRRL